MERRTGARQCVDEGGAALAEWSLGVVVVAEGEQVERVMNQAHTESTTDHRQSRAVSWQPTCGVDDVYASNYEVVEQIRNQFGDNRCTMI
jgi:dephospho-CoA kinase